MEKNQLLFFGLLSQRSPDRKSLKILIQRASHYADKPIMKALLPGQETERKVLNSKKKLDLLNRVDQIVKCTVYNILFENMKSMMTQCLRIAHEQGRQMDAELEAECLKTVFNCDYFWSK